MTCHSPRGDSKLRAPARHAHAMETLTVCAVFRSYRLTTNKELLDEIRICTGCRRETAHANLPFRQGTPDAIKTSSMHDMALQLAGRQMNYPEPPLGSLKLEKISSNTRDFSHKSITHD